MKTLSTIALVASLTACFSSSAQIPILQPLATFGTNGDGSIRAGDYPFITAASQLQRGMAFNPVTGHLLLVDRGSSSANTQIYILDGATGAPLTNLDGTFMTLDRSSIIDGGNASFVMSLIGVGDDGAIYAANLSNGTTTDNPQYHLYRWADETSAQTPVFGFLGDSDPSHGDTNTFQKRWGDTLTVRGAGLNTQVLIANRGTLAAIFTPDDDSYSHFTPVTLVTDVADRGALGVGLAFGSGNSFYGTSGPSTNGPGGPLLHLSFDTASSTATTLASISSPSFPGTMGPICVIPQSNLMAGITMLAGADVLRLYDITNPNAPVLLDRKSFATANNDNVYGGSVVPGNNGVLYALNSDNGIMAFSLTTAADNPMAPAFFLQPTSQQVAVSNNVTFAAGADSSQMVGYQWFFGANALSGATNASLIITNVQTANAGNYSVVASNALGSVTSSVVSLTVNSAPLTSLLVQDSFDYSAGSLISTQGNWVLVSGTSGTIDSGSLSVPGLAASIGNKLTYGSSMGLRLTNGGVTTTAGSIYFSLAYKLDAASTVPAPGANGGSVIGFQQGSSSGNSTYFAKVVVQTNAAQGGYSMGIFKRAGQNYGGIATNNLAVGDTVFVVGRYTFRENTTTDDTIDLWVNPDPSTFGASNAPVSSVGETGIVPLTGSQETDSTAIDRLSLRAASGPSKTYVDEVRVGLTWADVTPKFTVLEVTPTLSIGSNPPNVIVRWPTNSTGYTLEGSPVLPGASWTTISAAVNGTNYEAVINASSGNQFLRLRK